MRMKRNILVVAAVAVAFTSVTVSAATPAEWRSRSIYQVLTDRWDILLSNRFRIVRLIFDRFGRADNSTTATCNTGDRVYCGGTYQGIINHLDYIQNMGFTAVSFQRGE